MQMKILVDTPEDYKKWLKEKKLLLVPLKMPASKNFKDESW
jgi:heme/copper-type cytochrome/quinol oxidase subunit 2